MSIRAHHWGHDCAPGTACPAPGVSPAGVCLQPFHSLALRYRHGASVVGRAQQHPSLRRCDQGQRCIFVLGMPREPISLPHCQNSGFTLQLAVLPASQPLTRILMACTDGCSVGQHLPSPLCAAQHTAPLHCHGHPRVPWSRGISCTGQLCQSLPYLWSSLCHSHPG